MPHDGEYPVSRSGFIDPYHLQPHTTLPMPSAVGSSRTRLFFSHSVEPYTPPTLADTFPYLAVQTKRGSRSGSQIIPHGRGINIDPCAGTVPLPACGEFYDGDLVVHRGAFEGGLVVICRNTNDIAEQSRDRHGDYAWEISPMTSDKCATASGESMGAMGAVWFYIVIAPVGRWCCSGFVIYVMVYESDTSLSVQLGVLEHDVAAHIDLIGSMPALVANPDPPISNPIKSQHCPARPPGVGFSRPQWIFARRDALESVYNALKNALIFEQFRGEVARIERF
ncbi:hypothetical protein BD779DRAFT_1475395 [Infundibulicybe gibba]|nr:hypothetical protein BD779DRAFT_1475395 [Infundibulicybe gibba]